MKLIRHFLLLRSADLNVELDIVGLNLDIRVIMLRWHKCSANIHVLTRATGESATISE